MKRIFKYRCDISFFDNFVRAAEPGVDYLTTPASVT